ncbi:MAG TPA: hypothetical protein VET87_11925 [Rubrivivax sp.]|nr:hypothetical protein [Rubrivivax sp.]
MGEIDATLLTFKIRSDRPLWSEQFLEPAVSGRPSAAAGERLLPSELKFIASILERPLIDETPLRLRWALRRT